MKMLKKIMSLLAAAALALSFAGCSEKKPVAEAQFADSVAALNAIWQEDTDENKPSVFGGLGENMKEGEAAAVDLSQTELAANSLCAPEALCKDSENAAALTNIMMANAFTASLWQLKEGTDVQTLKDDIEKTISNQHWMCTFPEKYVIVYGGQYLLVVYGYADQVDPFVNAATEVLKGSSVIAENVIE